MTGIERFLRKVLIALPLFVLLIVLTPRVLPAESINIRVKSNLWFEGSSTLGSWACRDVPVQTTLLVPEVPADNDDLLTFLQSHPDTAFQPTLRFPVKAIGCEEGERMNNHMRNALRADKHPEVIFRVHTVQPTGRADTPPGTVEATVSGELTVSGTSRRISVPTTLRVTDPDPMTLRVRGELELDMTQYGVKPPTLMFGTLSVRRSITIHADFRVVPAE